MERENQNESVEEAIFKTLGHQKRRDILRFVGEKRSTTFTEIKNAVDEDSPTLSYHLGALDRLIVQKEGKYSLSDLGHDAYNLICKTTTYAMSNLMVSRIRKELPAVIIANAILWATALLLTTQFEGRLHQATILSFAALWFISNIILYFISVGINKKPRC